MNNTPKLEFGDRRKVNENRPFELIA